ncbi:uncharacterized protein K444DRAFT_632222 [Hyaloscypha bicolor E]|uniref:Uncharacterized protein n=1 Tax=Hyaloscypha bicolor E TaxID=1095630 RepID=A0A2J6T232_9HELO|nr:uncharacterized protein K444DRAFT_632222 [Hyaloscypha bicolor E]PMD57076.1 hypothetical protein K444DRAFT_632222 [Hyaloscypha bicolor E]
MVLPGHGTNVPVKHRTLPLRAQGYLIRPFPLVDIPLGRFGSLINGIIDGSRQPLPFANFGDTPISIPAGTCLGIFKECPVAPEPCQVFLNLAEVFHGDQPCEEERRAEAKQPAGSPFLLRPLADDPNVQADISKFWGPEVKNQVQDILSKYSNLPRNELSCFNNGVTIPIPFKDGVNLNDLRQVPYPMSRKDMQAFGEITDPMRANGSPRTSPPRTTLTSSLPSIRRVA